MQINTQTENLLLEALTAKDDEFVIALVNSEGWLRFIGDRNVHTKADAGAYIHKILNTPDFYYWVVKLKHANTPIGIISFLKRAYLEHFDLGFAFLPAYQGKGYAYEAAKKILSLACANNHNPVLATTVPGNSNSAKLLVKLGFGFDKELEAANQRLHLYQFQDASFIG